MNAQERFHYAVDLVKQGDYADATREMVWLWDHMLEEDRSLAGVRRSYLVDWMRRLAGLDENAQQQFTALRDKLTPEIDRDDPDFHLLMDWLTLSDELLDDEISIGRWIDRLLAMDEMPPALKLLGSQIRSWLCEHDRWADAGRLQEPSSILIAQTRLDVEREKYGFDANDELRKAFSRHRLINLVNAHVSYLAARRDDEAWAVADLILDIFDHERAYKAICEAVRLAGVESKRHAQLNQTKQDREKND